MKSALLLVLGLVALCNAQCTSVLRRGSRGECVRYVQRKLGKRSTEVPHAHCAQESLPTVFSGRIQKVPLGAFNKGTASSQTVSWAETLMQRCAAAVAAAEVRAVILVVHYALSIRDTLAT